MNKSAKTGFALFSAIFFLACACSKNPDKPKQDHVFKEYEQALDKAKQVQSQLDEAEKKRRKQMEEMTR
jgi:hypothetical protein